MTVEVCHFNGVTCDKNHHRVSSLVLGDSELAGLLSPFLSNLTGLRFLWINNNDIYGTIPYEFSYLKHLKSIRLDGNNLYGPIPASLFLIPNLNTILLLNSYLNGAFSPSFFSNCSSSLEILDFGGNSISRELPVEIGNCRNLWSLTLYNNQSTGQLPHSLTNTSLQNLDVEYNGAVGEIPSEIVRNLPDLVYLHLSYNNLKSHNGNMDLRPFFDAIQNCTLLEELELIGMDLSGILPVSIGQLGINYLTVMVLQDNQIVGPIPPSLYNYSMLRTLDLSSNLMTELGSDEMHVLSRLEHFFLSHNRFSGPISEVLGKFPLLGFLDLSHNNFSGEIPESLGNLSMLNYLYLNNNHLSGNIPLKLGRCTELLEIDLSYDRLTGKIPPTISGMSEIKSFINFSHNQLEGPLPLELTKLADVVEKDLSSNNLRGSLFPQISICFALQLINFSNNSLEGNVMRIITICSFPEFKGLVFPYMANGSLDSRLYELSSNSLSSHSSSLSLAQRVSICSDIAEGLAYLHHQSPIIVIHCDLKPSNVLLNSDMTALVSDFGISTLLTPKEAVENNENYTSDNTSVGSIGYIPPGAPFLSLFVISFFMIFPSF